jgi:hypothetical protein
MSSLKNTPKNHRSILGKRLEFLLIVSTIFVQKSVELAVSTSKN